ncbi:integrase core domain-containing protein [Prescottella equi]
MLQTFHRPRSVCRPTQTRHHSATRAGRLTQHRSIERFRRTMAAEWVFARHYQSEIARRAALPGWLHTYNHHRQHSAIGRNVPFSRTINVPGQYSWRDAEHASPSAHSKSNALEQG